MPTTAYIEPDVALIHGGAKDWKDSAPTYA